MNKELILVLLLGFIFTLLLFSLEFNLMNAFENATYQGREIMYRQAIERYNPQDGILNLPLVRGTRK